MSISQSNGKYPGWIDEFISAFSKTAGTVKADININDLDEIIWNDEKYRVMFDENGANIINEFGNTVTTLEGVKNLQEVDERLNQKQVVTESINISNEIEAEINEAMKYMNEEPVDIEVEQPILQPISVPDPITTSYPSKEEIAELVASKTTAILNEKFADFEDKMNTKFDESKFEPLENKLSNDDDEDNFDPMKDIMYDDPADEPQVNEPNMQELEQKITDIIDSKIDYMVNEVINQVTQKLSQLQIPSQDVMDIEKQQYDKSADETMQQINNENNTDRTTPEGFYNNHKENITDDELDGLDDTLVPNNNKPVNKGVEVPTEDEINDEVKKEVESDPDIPDIREQKPHYHEKPNNSKKPHHEEYNKEPLGTEVEADPLAKFRKYKCPMETEADVDPLTKLRKVKMADYEDDLTPSKIDDFSPNGQSQQPEQPQDPQQQTQQEQDNIQNVQPQNQSNEVLGSDAEIFKTAICPFCANKLYTESKDDEFLNISCGSCNTKYKVNLNNEKIYIR